MTLCSCDMRLYLQVLFNWFQRCYKYFVHPIYDWVWAWYPSCIWLAQKKCAWIPKCRALTLSLPVIETVDLTSQTSQRSRCYIMQSYHVGTSPVCQVMFRRQTYWIETSPDNICRDKKNSITDSYTSSHCPAAVAFCTVWPRVTLAQTSMWWWKIFAQQVYNYLLSANPVRWDPVRTDIDKHSEGSKRCSLANTDKHAYSCFS